MKPASRIRGITLRVALLGWLVALVTLGVFVVVIIPQQESEFKVNLESKARGVAASIKAVAAGAAVSEDYSVVVEQAMQVLSGDEAIDFVVITKNDGFSVITDRSTWKTESLDPSWRPERRAAVSVIETVPLFGRRVFHFATPFDYSGIEWGWVHIGLSLRTYDESVARSYHRTWLLTLFCSGLSLLISLLYARHLVRPIHVLHAAVEKVASGDWKARADVRTRDEIGRLAGAFNSMTATIVARNEVMESVGYAAQQLLQASDWVPAMEGILARLGRATGTSRVYVYQNEPAEGATASAPRMQWTAAGFTPAGEGAEAEFGASSGFERWRRQLSELQVVEAWISGEPGDRELLEQRGVKSMLLIPVVVGGAWWGLLGFEDGEQDRVWGQAEIESLRAVANMLGSTIIRHAAQEALIEANNTLERRVKERTRELQEQVAARERAHAELAAAQQRLVDLSREAGMAEVATGVLHNVGNVLNSVNVAATLVLEKVQHSKIEKLPSVLGLLQGHEGDIGEFLRSDPKGSHVLPYLNRLSEHLLEERQGMMAELGNLSRHVGHIKEIVAAQQGYATTAGFLETLSVKKLLEDAIALSQDGLDRHGIQVRVDVAPIAEVQTDKHKVLQIILNLVRNAKDAIRASDRAEKWIQLRVAPVSESRYAISVSDNGVGLAGEDLQRVFQHGFTKKQGGHGFGLHSGALAAQDLGGKLRVHSDGPDKGATFTLELPYRIRTNNPRSAMA